MKTIGIVLVLIVGSLTIPVAAAENGPDEFERFGSILSFEAKKIVVIPIAEKGKKLPQEKLDLSPDVKLLFNGRPAKRDDFATGNNRLIRYRLNSDKKVVEISQTISVGGFLKSVEHGQVVMATGGKTLETSKNIISFTVPKDTVIQIDRKDAKLADLKLGASSMCFIDKTGQVLWAIYQRTETPSKETKKEAP